MLSHLAVHSRQTYVCDAAHKNYLHFSLKVEDFRLIFHVWSRMRVTTSVWQEAVNTSFGTRPSLEMTHEAADLRQLKKSELFLLAPFVTRFHFIIKRGSAK